MVSFCSQLFSSCPDDFHLIFYLLLKKKKEIEWKIKYKKINHGLKKKKIDNEDKMEVDKNIKILTSVFGKQQINYFPSRCNYFHFEKVSPK